MVARELFVHGKHAGGRCAQENFDRVGGRSAQDPKYCVGLMPVLKALYGDVLHAFYSILTCLNEAKNIAKIDKRASRILTFAFILVICIIALLFWCNQSNSLTLTAFTHLLVFDFFSLLVALLGIWTRNKSASLIDYTMGYERFEVVAVFATTILTILSSFFEVKEAVERAFDPVEVYPQHMLLACLIGFSAHLITVYAFHNAAFAHVVQACSSSWLQEHTTDISRGLCHILPFLSTFLLPRVNPFSLVGFGASLTVLVVYASMPQSHLMITSADSYPDTVGCLLLSLMLFGTMFPMMLYSGRILLQTIPTHLAGPLEKALREASTIDGVLELRNEHVWSVGFNNLAGSLYVRVRRDANEQLVLAHVTDRLGSLVKHLTVQVYKDDWVRAVNWPPPPASATGQAGPNVMNNYFQPIINRPSQHVSSSGQQQHQPAGITLYPVPGVGQYSSPAAQSNNNHYFDQAKHQ